MVNCSHCNERQARYGGLCEQCYSKRSGKKPIRPPTGLTFDEFEARFLKEDGVTGLFYADDALLEYEYYKEYLNYKKKIPIYTPQLIDDDHLGDYREVHQRLERWFFTQFFKMFEERCKEKEFGKLPKKDILRVQEKFFAFRHFLNQIYQKKDTFYSIKGIPDFDPLRLFLKKAIVKGGKDPSPVDAIGEMFDPGSAFFILELYVTLQNLRQIDLIQQEVLSLSPDEVDSLIKSPSLMLLPWEHQVAAYEAWNKFGKKGIVVMATATGKTLVGLMAIKELARNNTNATIRIIANSRALLNQWKREVVDKLGLLQNVDQDYMIPIRWRGISVHFHTIHKIIEKPKDYPADLVIYDEVHHLTGPEYRRGFEINSVRKMGLSATVEGEVRLSILKQTLGPVVYDFSLKDALLKGVIPSFQWKVIPVYLAIQEKQEFSSISKSITSLFKSVKSDFVTVKKIIGTGRQLEDLGDFIRLVERARSNKYELPENWKQLQALILKRRWIIHKSQPRIDAAIRLSQKLAKDHKVILFTMNIQSCDYIGNTLKKDFQNVYVIHSQIREDPSHLIQRFRHAQQGALIGAQMLSEGIDIPDADIGINVAASKTRLQLTQRMGRILRKSKGKKPVFYHYVAIPEPENYIADEDDIAFLDDLSWVQDTALRMGLDAEIVWDEKDLEAQGLQVEDSFHRRFFGKDYTKIPKIGTFNLKNVLNQISDQAWYRIFAILTHLPADQILEDAHWSRIVRTGFGKKKDGSLDMPGFWWILILGKRRPRNILKILQFDKKGPIYRPDEMDKRAISETLEDLQKPSQKASD